ncbi:hypothetical protein MES4922_140037 [Mesorhizobium ventifaucium]|uniref:Uncharacterized protein n=1 Tax=Mesorhizobium ventifaucium TaxID=666020 RepID=A0ABN8JJ06_9HYPH|nr:hypothetical protein MES4922_140037 [Mesorhizobium ventifaucium]
MPCIYVQPAFTVHRRLGVYQRTARMVVPEGPLRNPRLWRRARADRVRVPICSGQRVACPLVPDNC